MPDRAAELIRTLDLAPHLEGGHYREIYRSADRVRFGRNAVDRCAVTQIYFVLRAGEHSRWHVVVSDEIWHHYEGDALELVTYDPATERVESVELGPPSDTARPAHVVRAGVWQAARPLGDYALAGCTVAPGFEFDDFRFVGDLPEHEAVFRTTLASFREML